MPKNSSEDFGGRRAEHSGSRCLYARAGYTVAVAVFVRIVHRAGATAEYNNGSDELLHGTTIIRGPGKVHGGAGGGGSGGRNEGAAVGDSPPFVDERDVASSFVPGHCSRRKAPYTAKYISLHLSYRRPGVQPPPVRLSSTLAPAK